MGPATNSYVNTTTAFDRFCSGDLPSQSALYNRVTGKGSRDLIYFAGEETGFNGRAFAHMATGAFKGNSYELPKIGKGGWENLLVNAFTGQCLMATAVHNHNLSCVL